MPERYSCRSNLKVKLRLAGTTTPSFSSGSTPVYSTDSGKMNYTCVVCKSYRPQVQTKTSKVHCHTASADIQTQSTHADVHIVSHHPIIVCSYVSIVYHLYLDGIQYHLDGMQSMHMYIRYIRTIMCIFHAHLYLSYIYIHLSLHIHSYAHIHKQNWKEERT
jgi:hypothetical protein